MYIYMGFSGYYASLGAAIPSLMKYNYLKLSLIYIAHE
jgi:hypothetical protein